MSKVFDNKDLEETQSFLSYKNLLEQDETSDESTETTPLNENNQDNEYERPNSPSILISPPDNDKQSEQIESQQLKESTTQMTQCCECKQEASTQTELLSVPQSPTMLRAAMTLCRLRPWQCSRTKKQREERKKLMQNNK